MTAFRVEHDAASLQSIATDGAMTANSAAKGDATDAFTQTHASELRKEAAELASVLASAHLKPGLADETTKLIALARTAAETCENLESHPSDKAVARRARADLEQVARRVEKLGKRM